MPFISVKVKYRNWNRDEKFVRTLIIFSIVLFLHFFKFENGLPINLIFLLRYDLLTV